MPSVQDFKKKNQPKQKIAVSVKSGVKQTAVASKRRPGREKVDREEVKEVKLKTIEVDMENTQTNASADAGETIAQQPPKVEVNFPGSEVLRAKMPKAFDVADQIATDWVNDGKFEGLQLGHPLAQVVAQQGLAKAKELEKKIIASPMTEKVAMQAVTAAMKAQGLFEQVRSSLTKNTDKKN